MSNRTITLNANYTDAARKGRSAWLDTGVDVPNGFSVSIKVSGTATSKRGTPKSGPDGNPGVNTLADFLTPNLTNGAVVGKFGNGDPFKIGSSYTGQGSGRLFVGYNDSLCVDNEGSFSIEISVYKLITLDATYTDASSNGRTAWLDTGVDVPASVTIKASGTATAMRGTPMSGPEGNPGVNALPDFLAPNLAHGALVGKIGSGDAFPIGASYTGQGSGRLFVGYNDSLSGDNEGSFSIEISVG